MTDATPQSPDDLETLAGEYVLGLLNPAERAQVERAAASSPALADAIAGWSARLEPLADLVPPAEPSDWLWQRIARDLPTRAPPARMGGRWKWAAIGGYALAASLAAFIFSGRRVEVSLRVVPATAPAATAPVMLAAKPAAPLPQPGQQEHQAAPPPLSHAAPPIPVAPARPPVPPPVRPDRALALLTAPGESQPSLKIHVAGGAVRVEALRPVSAAAGRQLDLWVWPHGEKSPILLGSISGGGGTLPLRVGIDDGTPMMVTSEPADLPNTGQQGPTLFSGELTMVD